MAIDRFADFLRSSLAAGTFVKLTLSDPLPAAEAGLRNVYARPVELRAGRRLSLLFRYATRDITKNEEPDTAVARLRELLGPQFERAHLFTTAGDWQLRCKPHGPATLKAIRPAFTIAPVVAHDRPKPRLAAHDAPFLQALGITNAAGDPRPGMADKLRQIERFTEILSHLLDDSPLRERRELRVLDLGAGKGYLTFAVAELLRSRGVNAEITGVELRQDLIDKTNAIARQLGLDHLRFVPGAISDFAPTAPVDVLIALHACDTATDDALHLGIRTEATLLITSPCCHRELRPQLTPPPFLHEIVKHGILLERESEIITDALRALLLEMHGYRASVSEFIALEHTARNLMITAHRRLQPLDPAPLRARFREILAFYGIREQRLARQLGEL